MVVVDAGVEQAGLRRFPSERHRALVERFVDGVGRVEVFAVSKGGDHGASRVGALSEALRRARRSGR